VKVKIGGVAGLVDDAPAFVRSDGPLYWDGPIWRMELAIPAAWPASTGWRYVPRNSEQVSIERLEKFRTWAPRDNIRVWWTIGSRCGQVITLLLLPLIRERSAYPAGLLLIQMQHQRPGCCGRNLSLGGGATIVRTSCNQSESLSKNLELRRKGSVPKMPVAV
jgi:hypothetical protein